MQSHTSMPNQLDDFPPCQELRRGDISIKYLPDGSMPSRKGDHWIILFRGPKYNWTAKYNWTEVRGWIEELADAGEPAAVLAFAFGCGGVIVQRRSSVTEAILKYS